MRNRQSILHTVFVLCLVSCVSSLLTSCKDKKDSLTIDYQYDYAPLDSGHYVIYDVDSISYSYIDPLQIRDTAHYQLKEEVGDTFYDLTNELSYELNLYRRANETSPWVYDRKWSVKRTATTFQKNEGDIHFVKLVFPPEEGKEWNGNTYVPTVDPYKDFLDWTYSYEKVAQPYSINGMNFDSALTVVEVNDSNYIDKHLRKEVYAKGVGMVYQEWEILKVAQGVNPNWQTGNLNGFRIRMRAREHN
jgi:hypothetical protein